MNHWHKIFSNFKETYPTLSRRVDSFRPLAYPKIEVIFRDGSKMAYDDDTKRAFTVQSESIYDRLERSDKTNKYLELDHSEYAKLMSVNLEEMMYQKKMKATGLSELTGIPYRTLRRYIIGERVPSAFDAVKISEALGCSINELTELRR